MAEKEEIKSFLLHLGHNMWCEWLPQELMTKETLKKRVPDYRLQCDEKLWLETTAKLAATGTNLLIIDIGEVLAYPSHPELAIEGSWSPDRMRAEVKRLKAMGTARNCSRRR